jgi:hypothetical protein
MPYIIKNLGQRGDVLFPCLDRPVSQQPITDRLLPTHQSVGKPAGRTPTALIWKIRESRIFAQKEDLRARRFRIKRFRGHVSFQQRRFWLLKFGNEVFFFRRGFFYQNNYFWNVCTFFFFL